MFLVDGDTVRPFAGVVLEEEVTTLDAEPDGGLLVTTGVPRPRLLRLRPDGTRDEAFDSALGALIEDWYVIRVFPRNANGEIVLGTYRRDRGSRLMVVSPAGQLVKRWEF
jgi:hypothetical protein